MSNIKLLCCIVSVNKGNKVLRLGRKVGLIGGTIFRGNGTISNKILNFLGLYEETKDIVIMATTDEMAKKSLAYIAKEMNFTETGQGIGFILPIKSIFGNICLSKVKAEVENVKNVREVNNMYQSIVVIVDRGKGDEVVEAAKKGGARGATIIHGRGSGIHETQKLFAMSIEPEKEIVLIIAKKELKDAITTSINKAMEIEQPGKGILFVQDLEEVVGLYE